MPTKLNDLYRLEKADISQAGKVLRDAFQEDPVWNAVFSDAKPEQREGFFETPVRYCHKYGDVYAPSSNLEGVAAWVPGALAEMSLWRMLRSGAIWSGMKMGNQVAKIIQLVFHPIEVDRKENMRGRSYIYLQIIGVATQFQGQGFGSTLLKALIDRSEQERLPLYLETETSNNVSMYEKIGFSVIKEIELPVINLPMWEMVREVA